MLLIYNTLSQEKEIFKPIHPGKIDFYVCGITVYDYCHIGHARVYLVFDTIIRYLRYRGFEVNYIRNITDIDDKIIKRADENQEPMEILTERFINAMHEDFAALNIEPATLEPRATEYVPQMITLIKTLMDKGYAYVGANGDVYYKVEKFESYGCLSHRKMDDLQAGARIGINESKQHPFDFVLWKSAKVGEPSWASPWGPGRPGWHIECSAMSLKNLGETFDIHGGGPDLKFPHHENERAQSEAATGKTFVNYWMHVGYVQIEKEKMAKSLGNFVTIREFLQHYHPEVLRYFSISSHYRSPVDYTGDHIDFAFRALERLYTALRGITIPHSVSIPSHSEYEKRFCDAMNDDFNTPVAIAVLFDLAREINRLRDADSEEVYPLALLLKKLGNLLGILNATPEEFLQNLNGSEIDRNEIDRLISERLIAKTAKDWKKADEIRETLLQKNIILEDSPDGKTKWSVKAR